MDKAKVIGVSVGGDGTVWCVDSVGLAYKMEGANWKRNPDTKNVKEIAVGDATHVWCRTDSGDVFQGVNGNRNTTWLQDVAAKNIQTISVGADSTVWVGNMDGKLFMRTMGGWFESGALGGNISSSYVERYSQDGGTWEQNPDAKDVVEISVGNASQVWSRNDSGKLFHLNGSSADSGWTADTQASWVQSVGVGADGATWLSSADKSDKNRLFKRVGANNWMKNESARAVQVSAGTSDHVYCVNDDGQIHRLDGSGWNSGWTLVALPDLPYAYLVKSGDTLGSIVQDIYGLTGKANTAKVDEIAALNGIEDKDEISAGELIALP